MPRTNATQLRNALAPNGADIVGSYLRSRWGRGSCCWRVMKVVPHTGLLWLFLSQPTGGEDGYGVLRNPWSDSVSAVRDEAELPITTVRSQWVSENTPMGTFVATETEKRATLLGGKQADLQKAKESASTATASQVFVVAFILFSLNGKKKLLWKKCLADAWEYMWKSRRESHIRQSLQIWEDVPQQRGTRS